MGRGWCLGVLCGLLLAGCQTLTPPGERTAQFVQAAKQHGLEPQVIPSEPFHLQVFKRITDSRSPLHVYIEGDGFAWRNASTPSDNPTPLNPVALNLAMMDPGKNVLYIGRPCQYVEGPCEEKYWTFERFAPEVIQATQRVVEHFQRPNQTLCLIGFSGGANIAALLATRLKAVACLETVVGNTDHVLLHELHHVHQLDPRNLNAADEATALARVKQTHHVGEKDTVVPYSVAESLYQKMGRPSHAVIRTYPQLTHTHGWETIWLESSECLGRY
jgi:hypothetical protein